jgi:Cft2 family RNA processing exonuclease
MASNDQIEFSVLGGGGEVGASCFRLALNGDTVILDCGTHPKRDGNDALPDFSMLDKAPDALIVSHAHQDHCGSVPYLVREFPMLRPHATVPTVRIMDRMLHNSVSVMGLIAKERGVADYPLYEHHDVRYALRAAEGHEFEVPFSLDTETPMEVSFHRAGHVLGSASVLLKTPGHTLFYTGDLCETNQELMAGYTLLSDDVSVDTLVIECTNGALEESRVFSYTDEIDRLGEALSGVLEGGGTALVPSFALGRTQEVLNIIGRLQEEGRVPDVPVYASGLGRAVYELYDRFEYHLQPDTTLRPLDRFGRIGNVWDPRVAEKLLSEPCIIVATSGMMLQNTPSSMIAQEMVRDKKHGIFFVGYLDHETLGYALLHSSPGDELQFSLGGPHVPVSLENIQRFHFSAHAPRAALQSVIEHIKPKNVIYVHGDPEAIDWMKENTSNGAQSYAPQIGETVTLSNS